MPWANGGGRTREVACFPAGTGPFDWRVSIADVAASGAFSALRGIDRVLVFLDGPAMTLTVDGAEHELVRGAPFAFDGGAVTSCRVEQGPTRDLNVMTRRGRCTARVSVLLVDDTTDIVTEAGRVTLVVPLSGPHRLDLPHQPTPTQLEAFDAVQLSGTARLLGGQGPIAIIDIDTAIKESV